MIERQGTGIREQGADAVWVNTESPVSSERVRELEAENARLKRLIGELLVANQVLRERTDAASAKSQ